MPSSAVQLDLLPPERPDEPPCRDRPIPVVDQTVPKDEQDKLSRMTRAIWYWLRNGERLTTDQMARRFEKPDGRRPTSVRTRVSELRRYLDAHSELRQLLRGEPVNGIVGDWVFWIERKP